MKIKRFKDRAAWLEFRRGKVTGTRLKDIITLRGTGRKKGFWELIAERISTPADPEDPMERGLRLEAQAITLFSKATGKKVNSDLIMWVSDDNPNMAISPDGQIGKTEACENKCLNSASHIEAYVTQKVPAEYDFQVLQYFIINKDLQTLYFLFYDPRVVCKPFFYIVVNRQDVEEDIIKYSQEEVDVLAEVDRIVAMLTGSNPVVGVDPKVWLDV